MRSKRERNQGLAQVATGLGVLVLAVLLFGVTTDSGSPDWASIITAVAGVLMAVLGLFTIVHAARGGPR